MIVLRNIPIYQIPKKGLTVWRLYGVIGSVITLFVATGICFTAYWQSWSNYIYYIVIAVWLLEAILTIWLIPNIRWKHWRYEVREHEIEIQSGLFVVKRTLIPMIRVQHVDTTQGPILKKYNLSNISISTAATTHTIPMLISADADLLRARISELARVAEDDV